MNFRTKSKYVLIFILIHIFTSLYTQEDSLYKAQRLCNEKKFHEAIPIIDRVIYHADTKYDPASWHIRSYAYLVEYKKPKIINKSRTYLLDSAMVSVATAMKLDSSKLYFENNSAFLKNGTSLYYKACSVFLNDSLDFKTAEQCYLKYRKYSGLLSSDFDYKANDIIFYNAVGCVFSELYLKNYDLIFLDLAKKTY